MTLYGKPGCHLCDEAREVVDRVRAEHPFDLREVDVSLDPGLNREYGERIPVLGADRAGLGTADAWRQEATPEEGGEREPPEPA